ncbi:MAG: hypothetical protein FWH12_02145 [Treponema sp.]|nr:hypothetical protein [Treponema sp.]
MGLPKPVVKFIFIPLGIILVLSLVWTLSAFIGRVRAASIIPPGSDLVVSIPRPLALVEGILSHEPLKEMASVPELRDLEHSINELRASPLLKNPFVRLAARGNLVLALLPDEGPQGAPVFIAAWDLGIFSPLLRVLPWASRFIQAPNLYYVQAGRNSRFEYRLEGLTLYIGPHKNLLVISSSSAVYEARALGPPGEGLGPSDFDAALLISPSFFAALLSEQDQGMGDLMAHINFDSPVEAGLTVGPHRLELHLGAALSSSQAAIEGLLQRRGAVPEITERFPEAAQYAAVISIGTLEELLEAALVFSGPELGDLIRQADSASRTILRLTLEDLLFSWSGSEMAVFAMEGRPHPVYAIQVRDEGRRQEVFDRAFRSIALSENVRLNLDGTRIPQIEVPGFIQSLLRRWDINLPSPYYIVHQNYLFLSESADTLLAAMRAIQRNEILPRSAQWQEIAGGARGGSIASAFSLYYSLDVAVPFFLREQTLISSFLRIYRQGLVRVNLDRGQLSLQIALVPGSGSGMILVASAPIQARQRPSNLVYGAGDHPALPGPSRIFLSAGESVLAIDPGTMDIIGTLEGQGQHWIIPAQGLGTQIRAWVVNDRGRVSLVDGNLEQLPGFPVVTGLRLSSPPEVFNGMVYLSCEDGRVHSVDAQGRVQVWETSFFAALRSPPTFMTLVPRGLVGQQPRHFAATYPKSFFGEVWLLDHEGRALPNWPASLLSDADDDFSFDSGLGFGSPLLFAQENRLLLAFVSQAGDLFIFDEEAREVPPFPIKLGGVFFQQPLFDGQFLWLISAEGFLFRVSLEGEVLLQGIPGFQVREEGQLILFDYDGDGIPEIFITGEGNALHGYTRNFRSLESFPLPLWGRPYFIEAQGNRRPEIIGMGMDALLYRWQFR